MPATGSVLWLDESLMHKRMVGAFSSFLGQCPLEIFAFKLVDYFYFWGHDPGHLDLDMNEPAISTLDRIMDDFSRCLSRRPDLVSPCVYHTYQGSIFLLYHLYTSTLE